MSTTQNNENIITQPSDESQPPMLDASLLATQIENLESTAGKLSTANVVLLYIAGAVAVLLAVHAFWSNRVNARLRNAQNDVIRAKDEQAARDKQASSEKIAGLTAEAENAKKERAQADLKIAEAGERASKADERAGEANERAERANREAIRIESEGKKRAGELELRAQELARQNLATEARLEEEKRTRLEIEKSVAPREIMLILNGDKSNIDSLKPFGGMKAIIEFLPDAEPRRAADNLALLLKKAGWNVVNMVARPELAAPFFDDVVIDTTALRTREGDKAREAAYVLITFLRNNGWKARHMPAHPRDLDINEVKIRVGFKSSPYLLSQEVKDAMREVEQYQERIWRQIRERQRRLEEEIEKRRQKPE